jgi:hypothetical protein
MVLRLLKSELQFKSLARAPWQAQKLIEHLLQGL